MAKFVDLKKILDFEGDLNNLKFPIKFPAIIVKNEFMNEGLRIIKEMAEKISKFKYAVKNDEESSLIIIPTIDDPEDLRVKLSAKIADFEFIAQYQTELTLDNFTTAEICDLIFGEEFKARGFETVGHVAHFNFIDPGFDLRMLGILIYK